MIPEKKVPIKVIKTASEMSNLVGMYAFLVVKKKIEARIYIAGKADNKYFICQFISPLTGAANTSTLMTLEELKDWHIMLDKKLADDLYEIYNNSGNVWRFGNPLEQEL